MFDTKVHSFPGSATSMPSVISRLAIVKNFATLNVTFVTVVASLYSFAYMAICVHGSCVCVVRIGCIVGLNFVEERIGEKSVRVIAGVTAATCATVTTAAQVFSGEINTGTVFCLLTGKMVEAGT